MSFFFCIKTFFIRNTYRIEGYRLRSYFNISNNKFDAFFAKTKYRKIIFKIFLRTIYFFKYILNLKQNIHSIDFNLTTSCNLNCIDCASLMPYYKAENQWTIDIETFKKDLDNLLLYTNKIYRLKLIGGEPLLVKGIEEMLDYACSKKKIISIIITTNTSIIPSDKLCKTLKKYNKKALVELSDYSNSIKISKCTEIEKKLKENDIYYFISNYEWFECGKIYKRNRTQAELIQIYKNCFQSPCLSLFDGKIYNCTKAAAINRLTNFKFDEQEIIDIRDIKIRRNALKKFYSRNFYSFCTFCTSSQKRVERGIQTKERFNIT